MNKIIYVLVVAMAILAISCTQESIVKPAEVITEPQQEVYIQEQEIQKTSFSVMHLNNRLETEEIIIAPNTDAEIIFINRDNQTARLSIPAMNVDAIVSQNEEFIVLVPSSQTKRQYEFEFANRVGQITIQNP